MFQKQTVRFERIINKILSNLDTNSPEKEDAVLVEENGQESNEMNGKSDIAWPSDELETSQLTPKPDEEQTSNKELTDQLQQSDSKSSIEEDEFNDDTFHCRDLLHMQFDSLDPSLALGFICTCDDDFNDLIEQLKVGFIDLLEY